MRTEGDSDGSFREIFPPLMVVVVIRQPIKRPAIVPGFTCEAAPQPFSRRYPIATQSETGHEKGPPRRA